MDRRPRRCGGDDICNRMVCTTNARRGREGTGRLRERVSHSDPNRRARFHPSSHSATRSCDVCRIVVSLAGAITRRVAARTTRYGRARWAPPRFSVCTVRRSGARKFTNQVREASASPPSRRALSRRGTLNRARDAEPRDVDARLLSRPSAGTPSVSFAMRFTRTRVWWVRTRRRRSPGPRRTSSSSSDRRRCTSSSAASSRASSTPSTAKREVRRSAAKRDAPNRR